MKIDEYSKEIELHECISFRQEFLHDLDNWQFDQKIQPFFGIHFGRKPAFSVSKSGVFIAEV